MSYVKHVRHARGDSTEDIDVTEEWRVRGHEIRRKVMAALKSYVRLVNVPDLKKLWDDWGVEGGYGNPAEGTMDLTEVSQEVVRMAAGRPHQLLRICRLLGTNREEVQLRTPNWCLAGNQAIRKFAGGLVAGELV